MSGKQIVATILEAAGVLAIAYGVYLVSRWGALVTLGAGLIVFGIAIEREIPIRGDSSAPATPVGTTGRR
ncbi:MAG: hypothetical protein JWO62_2562 [Acidimicrobiaceae bacterium]|nr:hypothetical protein [Acidimicrobiaceae bacterium]